MGSGVNRRALPVLDTGRGESYLTLGNTPGTPGSGRTVSVPSMVSPPAVILTT